MGFFPSGDGIAAALLTLEALEGGDLAERAAMEKLPQRLVNVRVPDRDAAMDSTQLREAVEREGSALEGRGRSRMEALREMTDGRGPDSVLEAVGMEAHGSPGAEMAHKVIGLMPDVIAEPMMKQAGIDRMNAIYLAIDAVRRGGTVSISGVYGGQLDPMPLFQMFDKQLNLRMGQANVKRWVGQFETKGPDATKQTERKVGDLKVTMVEIKGVFNGSGMPGGPPAAPKPDFVLLGAIIETSGSPWFFKLTGPEKTVEAAKADFERFVDSIRPK